MPCNFDDISSTKKSLGNFWRRNIKQNWMKNYPSNTLWFCASFLNCFRVLKIQATVCMLRMLSSSETTHKGMILWPLFVHYLVGSQALNSKTASLRGYIPVQLQQQLFFSSFADIYTWKRLGNVHIAEDMMRAVFTGSLRACWHTTASVDPTAPTHRHTPGAPWLITPHHITTDSYKSVIWWSI